MGITSNPRHEIVVSEKNSTTLPLSASASFIGEVEDISAFEQVTMNIAGEPLSADGTLFFDFSPDGINFDVTVPFKITLSSFIPVPLRTVLPYIRIRFINGSMDQTEFRLTTVYHSTGSKHLTRFPFQSLSQYEPVENVRALAEASQNSWEKILDADKSIFGSVVVSQRTNQISANFSKLLSANLVSTNVVGTGDVTQLNGKVFTSTGIGVTSSAKVFSNKRIRYTPGKEMYSTMTAVFTSPIANSSQRAGIFDDSNGFFFGYEGMTFGFTRRKDGIDTFFPKSSFNGDVLDGGGFSQYVNTEATPVIWDAHKINVYRIRFGYLGSSPVFFEIMGPNGRWIKVHSIGFPNLSTETSISNPELPVQIEVKKQNADATILQISSASWAAGSTAGIVDVSPSLIGSNSHVDTSLSIAGSGSPQTQTVYTIPAGRRFRLTSFSLNASNTTANLGEVTVTDGPSTVKIRLMLPGVQGTAVAQDRIQFSGIEPIPFLQDVRLNIPAIGTKAGVSIMIVGYEELS